MKVQLNKFGINKVVSYIGEDKCKYANPSNSGDFLFGVLEESDIEKLKDINIDIEHVGAGLHRVYLINEYVEENEDSSLGADDTGQSRIVDPKTPIKPESEEGTVDQREMETMARQLIPYLERYFPTKDEINDALNKLKEEMIDPNEMLDNMELQIKNIKKQSQVDDEINGS